jgi:hypothetical protein
MKTKEIAEASRVIESSPCLSVSASEIVQHCYHESLVASLPALAAPSWVLSARAWRTQEDGTIKYIVLDCRPAAQFNNGRLPQAVHLPPALLDRPEEMIQQLNEFSALKDCHFCLMGAADPLAPSDEAGEPAPFNTDVTALFLIHFLQRGFPHMSRWGPALPQALRRSAIVAELLCPAGLQGRGRLRCVSRGSDEGRQRARRPQAR